MKQIGWLIRNGASNHLTLGEWLAKAHSQLRAFPDESSSSLYAIIAYALEKPRYWSQAHPETILKAVEVQNLNDCLKRLLSGEPLPYITGKQAFYGLDFLVTPDVLIPRPETEMLVAAALDWLEDKPENCLAADIGTGSGCIAVSIAKNNPRVRLLAADYSYKSLRVAKRNIQNYHLVNRIDLIQTDLLAGVQTNFDLICANLPYIPAYKLSNLRVASYEPLTALDGGIDGLSLINKLLSQAKSRIKPSSLMFLEIEFSQSSAVKDLIYFHFPKASVTIIKDLNNLPRLVKITF